MPHTSLEALMPMLRRRARRLSQSRHDAEDLLQDALLRVLQKQQTGQEIDALGPYAMRTLHNQARMRWRAPPAPQELEEDTATIAPVALLRLECADALRAISDLPVDQCEVMQMVLTGETSPAVMAETLGLPIGTVMSRLARARARLRATLDP
jgi:RNA polymerase sigma factor (sigma-70 family)